MPVLPDGTVVSSFMGLTPNNQSGATFNNSQASLRVGRVSAVYPAKHPDNVNKKFIEYDIEVFLENGSSTHFPRCLMSSVFGGIADYVQWTPRYANPSYTDVSEGSYVLIACINSNAAKGIIIGGIPHPKSEAIDANDGTQLKFRFNGINVTIDHDGAFKLSRNGPTRADGTILSGSQGSFITFGEKNEGISVFSTKDILFETKEGFEIKTKFGVKINPLGTNPQNFLKGTLYRTQQKILHQSLKTLINTLTTQMTAVATALTTAGAQFAAVAAGYPAPAVKPQFVAGAVAVTAAATTLASTAPTLTAMQTAITAFESLDTQYLSKIHAFAEDTGDL